MSPDMFHDAVSSTPIPVFTSFNEVNKNDSSNLLQNVPDGNSIQNELIKIDFDKQLVSARALYNFLELAERFSKWCKRMFSYGLVENVDYTAVNNGTNGAPNGTPFVPLFTNSEMEEIDDYLLTINAANNRQWFNAAKKVKKIFFGCRNASDSSKRLPLSRKQQ